MRSADSFCLFLCASLRSSLRVLSSLFSVRPTRNKKKFASNELASAIDDRRCFCSRGGRHFDTPVAQQRSHTRKPFEFSFIFFGQISLRNIERCRNKKKSGERQRHQESLTAVRTIAGDRSPATYSLEAAENKKKLGCLSLLKTHTLLAIKLVSPTARSPKLFYRFLPRQTPRTR